MRKRSTGGHVLRPHPAAIKMVTYRRDSDVGSKGSFPLANYPGDDD